MYFLQAFKRSNAKSIESTIKYIVRGELVEPSSFDKLRTNEKRLVEPLSFDKLTSSGSVPADDERKTNGLKTALTTLF